MTYRCGIGPGIPGMEPGPPRITCDVCGLQLLARRKSGGPPLWLLAGSPPPGWGMVRRPDGTRLDYCPEHKDGAP